MAKRSSARGRQSKQDARQPDQPAHEQRSASGWQPCTTERPADSTTPDDDQLDADLEDDDEASEAAARRAAQHDPWRSPDWADEDEPEPEYGDFWQEDFNEDDE